MASITSLMNSSSTSSIYGNRNVISGLASGMDTEAMIENSIKGYKNKISALQQRMTKTQWKQDAYRGLIAQMNSVLSKYTSYSSSTNLFSPSFFTKAVTTTTNGANAGKVSATGRSSSNVALDRVLQLAQAATYSVGTDNLTSAGSATEPLDLSEEVETSAVAGSISIKYGGGETGSGSNFTLYFDENEIFTDDVDADGNVTKSGAQKMADAINEKLKEKNIKSSSGSNTADNYIKAEVTNDGRIVLNDLKGNYFKVTGVSGGMESIFSEGEASGRVIVSNGPVKTEALVKETKASEYLKDKSINVSLDGKTKNIKLDFITEGMSNKDFADKMQEKLDEAFGKGKVGVQIDDNGGLKFGGARDTDGNVTELKKGTTLNIGGSATVNKALGMKETGYSNTMQTSWKLSDVLGEDKFTEKQLDADGKEVEGSEAKYATLTINGEKIQVSKDDTIKSMMDKINGSDAGVEIKYSNLTGRFAMTAKETGADTKIEIEGDLGKALFGDPTDVGADYKAGQNAKFTVTVNGEQMELERSSNTVDLDGLSVTLKGTFGYKAKLNADGNEIKDADGNVQYEIDPASEAVTFTTKSDSDKIVDAVKAFVEDYNKLVTDLHNAYTTEPLKNSNKEEYQPLTEEQESQWTETAIKNYEEKAKTGLLFADSDLSNLYSKLTDAIQGNGEVGSMLRSIGITTSYSSRLTTIDLDEEALRNALETNPDRVKDAFTQTTANGASSDGLMANLKSTLEQYGSTSIANPGILVNKAGTTLSSYSLSHNELNDQMDSLQTEIEKWQDKMSDRVDYYTNKFTQLEMLINKMNSQSSMLAGLSGGY